MSHSERGRFLSGLNEEDLAAIRQAAKARVYADGSPICRQGMPGDGVFLIEQGTVRICFEPVAEDLHELYRLGPGELFGEMAVLDNLPRSATVLAEGEVRAMFIPRVELMRLFEEHPRIAVGVLRQIANRFRDFSRQHVEQILRAERLALVGRFTGSIVHDIRAPLQTIELAAELSTDPEAGPEMRAAWRDRIVRQAHRVDGLITELLEFSRGEDARVDLKPLQFADFILRLVDEAKAALAERKVEIVMENRAPQTFLAGDADRLERVFQNLFTNSRDAMPDGGSIKLRFRLTATELITEVEDTGPGIPEDVVNSIFQPFVTHGKVAGTGLGLSICRRIVEAHGGRIATRREEGRGAIFVVSLPVHH